MLYYRGSSTYADAVANQLNTLEETGLSTSLAINNLESDIQNLRSDYQTVSLGLYNQGQGIRNDIQSMALGFTSTIQDSTYAVVASQQMIAKSFTHGFNSVNNTLDFGFNLLGDKIDVFSENICSRLDQIHDILNNPRLTESRELYREALRSYQNKYFEEALESCKGAVEKNKTDYVSWYLLGMIYLFGAGKFSNVIDLDKAEDAFFNAAKYVDSDIGQSEEANVFASEIYYYLGYARLFKSNDYLLENKTDASNSKLIEAEKASRTAYQLSNDNLLAGYEQAKELHFLGKEDESLSILEKIIRREKNFAVKAINDKNFESLKKKIETLILKLRDEVVDKIIQQCNDFRDMYSIKHRQNKLSRLKIPSEKEIIEFENFYNEEFNKKDYQYLKKEICEDFNDLSKEIEQKTTGCRYGDIFCCETIIKRIRKRKDSLQQKLDKVLLRTRETLNSFETVQEKDYFFVLQKNIEFRENNNQDKLKSVSSEIITIFNDFDTEFEQLNTDIQCMHLWFASKKEWDKTKIKLRKERIDEIVKECNFFRDSWKEKINKLNHELSGINIPDEDKLNKFEKFYSTKLKQNKDIYYNFTFHINIKLDCKSLESYAYIKENLQNGKKYIKDELDLVFSRIAEVFKVFEIYHNDDYFLVLKKFRKLMQCNLQFSSSYFEYTLSRLEKEIEELKKDTVSMSIYIDEMKGY